MQKWKKCGVIFKETAYAALPSGFFRSENELRVFFSSRDANNQSIPYFIDLDMKSLEVRNLTKVDIPFGDYGRFDENGIMPTSVIEIGSKLYLYYIGWNLGKTVPFRNAIGLAVSDNNGLTFRKYFEGPLLDRSIHDKCFVASNCIFSEENFFRMYYLSCDKWEKNERHQFTHSYNIKYAESVDGINWLRTGKVMIDFKYENEYAISAPRVLKDDNLYKMWYSHRGGPKGDTYRIGYAESDNAVDWCRKDEDVSLDTSSVGWDSEMMCYPFIFDYDGRRFMLYNGNSYGKSGLGLAVLEQE